VEQGIVRRGKEGGRLTQKKKGKGTGGGDHNRTKRSVDHLGTYLLVKSGVSTILGKGNYSCPMRFGKKKSSGSTKTVVETFRIRGWKQSLQKPGRSFFEKPVDRPQRGGEEKGGK